MTDSSLGARASGTGLSSSTGPASRLGPSGFDPSRMDDTDWHVLAQDISHHWSHPEEQALAYQAADEALKLCRAEMERWDRNETRNCLNWGPCSRMDPLMETDRINEKACSHASHEAPLRGLRPTGAGARAMSETERCKRCGGENPPWSAPSPLWNAVMRGGSINGAPLFGDMVCATCFMILAEERDIATLWRVEAERVMVPLETLTPSGRIWDAERWLWIDSHG